MKEEFREIPIDRIKTLENIRTTRVKERDIHELMDSIKQQGLLQPIGIWETKKNEYIIAYGNRRLEACKKLGWKTITAKILGELSMEDLLILNASENIHRKETNLAELGRICNMLEDHGLSKEEIAVRLSQPLSKIRMAVSTFRKIPIEYRDDIVFMKPGTKKGLRKGKIPANIFHAILQMERTFGLNRQNLRDIMKVVKGSNLTYSEMMTLSAFLRSGSSLKEAMINLKEYHVRRINVAVNKKAEAEIKKKYGFKTVFELFVNILSGNVSGNPDLILMTEQTI